MRALVVGIDGHIGAHLSRGLVGAGWDVVGTTRRAKPNGSGRHIGLDLAVDDLASLPLPDADVVFFCAAMARFADCRERPDITRRVNVVAPAVLGRRLVATGTRVVLLSSSAVFDGSSPFFRADHPPRPLSPYGVQKAEAEAEVLALGHLASVFRLTKVLAPDLPLIQGWISALRRGTVVRAFDDLTIAPLAVRHVVSGLLAVTNDNRGGIYQVSGARDISYAQIANRIAEKVGADPMLVQAASAVEAGIPTSDALPYTSLDVSRMATLCDWRAPDCDEVLSEVYDLDPAVPNERGI